MTSFGTPPGDPHATPAQDAQHQQQSAAFGAAGTLSPDGRWVWDGHQWQPAGDPGPAAAGPPQAPVSPGGPYQPYGQTATPTIGAGPAPGLAYAGFWIRFVAYVIDSVLLFAVVLVLAALTGGIVRTDPVTGVQTVNGAFQGLAFIIGVAYFVGFWGTRSQTPGMMALNLRIARAEDGGPLDLGRAAIRYVGYVISGLVFGLGFLWIAFDSRKQGWHDKIARTFVVRQY